MLLVTGKKWRLSPYMQAVHRSDVTAFHPTLAPILESPVLDLVCRAGLPARFAVLDCGTPAGLGIVATLDVLAAWETACALFDVRTGLELVETCFFDPSQQAQTADLQAVFATCLESRLAELSEASTLSQVTNWAKARATQPSWKLPTLALMPAQLLATDVVDDIARNSPTGSILVALTWETDRQGGNIFQWRRKFLAEHPDFVAAGPCAQEFGNQLPADCDACFPGRREYLHYPDLDEQSRVFAWSYAMVTKSHGGYLAPEPEPTLALRGSVEVPYANVRYMGTTRERAVSYDHPDNAEGNPGKEDWAEYLKVCPAGSNKTRLAIKRRSAMQVPPLRFGQILALDNLLIQAPYAGHPEIGVIDLRNEASIRSEQPPPLTDTFLVSHGAAQRAAVDEAFFRLFGYPAAYPFQHTILARALQGRSIFSIVATGGGKSECYILPALLLPGITVVVSPLKSLMQDQYEQRIHDRYGIDHIATFINGDVPFYEREARLRRMVLGHYRLIYVTPEQLEQSYVLAALHRADQEVGVRYLAMDEAHCISQWGHDFRTSYLNILERLQAYGISPVIMALTATASPIVRDDVCHELGLSSESLDRGGDVLIESSNRPELNLVVRRCKNAEEKAELTVNLLSAYRERGSAIVFMPYTGGLPATPHDFGVPAGRYGAEYEGMVSPGVTAFARYVGAQLGEPVAMYHGSLNDDKLARTEMKAGEDEEDSEQQVTRQGEQRAFMSSQKRIMIATKGFGMGIDKPDIRLVIHRSPPANLEAYAQEAGRAGRDKKQATVALLFSEDTARIIQGPSRSYLGRDRLPSDREIQDYFVEHNYVRRQDVEAVLAFLRSGTVDRHHSGLYFTNDQIVETLDSCTADPNALNLDGPFEWPDFEYRGRGGDTSDYWRIHRRGQEYKAKRDHVQRVIDVIFDNRPSINGIVVPAVHSAHRVETMLIDFRLYDPERIIASRAYFGELLRGRGITAPVLRELLPDGDRVDLTDLARLLETSLRDTLCMLRDIRHYQGRSSGTQKGNSWVGTLLNFRRAEAPRRVNLATPYDWRAWREYAGASRGVKPPTGRTDLDDYFPAYVVNKPCGWEVVPGPGLQSPDPDAYLTAFMALHDQRRENDRSNFAFLLDRYVGADGHPPECLRSLLLGYLKTNEVVVGGKCYSCSVCVPDLDFERYPVEARASRVVRLTQATVALAEELERSNRSLPTTDLVSKLLAAIKDEDQQGRSGTAYLESWLARLIQDDSQHLGAHRCRLAAADCGLVQVRPNDAVASLERMAEVVLTAADLTYVEKTAINFESDGKFAELELRLMLVQVTTARKLEHWKAEVRGLHRVVELTQGSGAGSDGFRILQDAYSRLLDLYQPGGPAADPTEARCIAQATLHLPGLSPRTAERMYRFVLTGLAWPEVLAELQRVPELTETIVRTWLSNPPLSVQQEQAFFGWLTTNSHDWDHWSRDTLLLIKRRLTLGVSAPSGLRLAFGMTLVGRVNEVKVGTELLLLAWLKGEIMEPSHWRAVTQGLLQIDVVWFRGEILAPAGDRAAQLLEGMILHAPGELPSSWYAFFPTASLLRLCGRCGVTASRSLLTAKSDEKEALAVGSQLALRVAPDVWATEMEPFFKQRPHAAVQLLNVMSIHGSQSEQTAVRPEIVTTLFPALLTPQAQSFKPKGILDQLCARPVLLNGSGLVPVCLDAWLALRGDAAIWPLLRQTRIESGVLVGLTKRWLADRAKLHRLDLLVIILRDVRRASARSWLTPPSLELQVLCAAGRFKEASELAQEYDGLRAAGHDAEVYLREARATTAERTPLYISELEGLWRLIK